MLLRRPAIGKAQITLVVLAVILAAVAAYIVSNDANDQLCMGCAGQGPSGSSSLTRTSSCSSVATKEDPLVGFRALVNYSRPWTATVTGYSNSTAHPAFTKCYSASGTGWILINNWNPRGGSILNVTISKSDGSSGNLTATLGGERGSTIAPYGSVKLSETEVP